MNPTPPPAASAPRRDAATRRHVTRASVALVAVGVVLVAALVAGMVGAGRWGYAQLRTQARTSPYDTAGAAPPVVGPANPAPAAPRGADVRPAPGVEAAPAPVAPEPPNIDSAPGRSALHMPVDGVAANDLYPSFDEARGTRRHEAIDIMAPRGTPVRAAVDGKVVKLFTSDAGGLTVYQFDGDERLAYYYAHLDRYADGLREGTTLSRGDVLGYVGSTGNARADAPHLHFAIFELGPEKRWWEGRPIDPYPLLGGS